MEEGVMSDVTPTPPQNDGTMSAGDLMRALQTFNVVITFCDAMVHNRQMKLKPIDRKAAERVKALAEKARAEALGVLAGAPDEVKTAIFGPELGATDGRE